MRTKTTVLLLARGMSECAPTIMLVRRNCKLAERGEPIDQVHKVTKYGCCGAPNAYSYFSLRTGAKLRTTHTELNPDELAALEKSL